MGQVHIQYDIVKYKYYKKGSRGSEVTWTCFVDTKLEKYYFSFRQNKQEKKQWHFGMHQNAFRSI